MSDDEFHELHNLPEASEDNLKSISVSPCDDGLSPGSSPNDGDENKQPDLEPPVLQASKSKSNCDDKGKQPVLEPRMPQASTPATPSHRKTMHRIECGSLFKLLLSHRGHSKATVLSAGDLGEMLKKLGMSPEVTEDELRDMLKTSRYADESGFLDFEHFTIFAEDFELLESLLAYNASQLKGGEYSERGPLGDFFNALAASHRDTKHRKECDVCFQQLLSHRGDPNATVLPAGDLCEMLKKLGMSPEVTEDELQDILKSSEYADENGTLDFERFMIFARDFELLKSLRAYRASWQKGGEYVERGPLRTVFKILESDELEPGFPGSSSNDGDKRKQPIFEPPVLQTSTSATTNYRETMHHKECKSCFNRLLSRRGDPKAIALRAGDICVELKKLGMAPEVTDDELRDMLKFSGYADENGTLDFERFTRFAKDFALLESLRDYKASRLEDRGPLGDFFGILKAGEDLEFSSSDFDEAFGRLGIELTEENADSLARYANLHPGVNITFEQFAKVLRNELEENMQRTGQTMSSRRKVALDTGYRLGRLMAFVSSYTRSDRVLRKAVTMVRNNNIEREGDVD